MRYCTIQLEKIMSHFVVLVFGGDHEAQLKPYDENLTTAPRKEPVTVEELTRMLEFYVDKGEGKNKLDGFSIVDGRVLKPDMATLCRLYKDYDGKNLHLGATGEYFTYTTYNEHSKWDWYLVGGRWTGYFTPKKEPKFPDDLAVGVPGTMTDPAGAGKVDVARKRDIDLEAMATAFHNEALAKQMKRLEAVGDLPHPESWSAIIERHGDGISNRDAARVEYHAQPAIVALKKAGVLEWFDDDDVAETLKPDWPQKHAANALTPFAFVLDGVWYERGRMGWFGSVSGEQSREEWSKQFWDAWHKVADDALVTAVDCHI